MSWRGRRYLLCRLVGETPVHAMGAMRFRCLPSPSPDHAHISSISMAKANMMTAPRALSQNFTRDGVVEPDIMHPPSTSS